MDMLAGFLKDGQEGSADVVRWVEGEPQRGFFGGVKMPPDRNQLPVRVFLCRKCGWLDSFAELPPRSS